MEDFKSSVRFNLLVDLNHNTGIDIESLEHVLDTKVESKEPI